MSSELAYHHVDVFSERAFGGNGLAVVLGADALGPEQMLAITRELNQFESVFVVADDGPRAPRLRVFTVDEELDFAGHPVLGAAAVMHAVTAGAGDRERWSIGLGGRALEVVTARRGGIVDADMNQGPAATLATVEGGAASAFADALGLAPGDLHAELPLQVVTTGLPYLLVPVARGLERAAVRTSELEAMLAEVGARFVYVLDPERPEGRTWDNRGQVEDAATGSAAGPTAAYLCSHGRAEVGVPQTIHQGRFAGRPSAIAARVGEDGDVWVGGPVAPVAHGWLRAG